MTKSTRRPFTVNVAIAKTSKYASRESGDTAEALERPGGGISVVLVDGQGSGLAAKSLSLQLTAKAVALLKEGVRDGAVARAVHDTLFAFRHGKVSAAFDIISADYREGAIVVTRNAETAYLVRAGGSWQLRPSSSGPIGLYRFTRPVVDTFQIEVGAIVVVWSDGIASAGRRKRTPPLDLLEVVHRLGQTPPADEVVAAVLGAALELDERRPGDDMTVVALSVGPPSEAPLIRRMSIVAPVE